MKNLRSILTVWLILFSAGQSLHAASISFASLAEVQATIQPTDAADDSDSYPPTAIILNGSSSAEVIFAHSNQMPRSVSETTSEQDEETALKADSCFRKQLNQQLGYTQLIERHFTSKELLYPFHHFL
ncbi:hypothetical protein [Gracilimonas mengyeensis]|uniref:Uncharacterized protein n=1 Tax=Gracilimonas mengyeensis TaxID=1302730 RepID=A0A521DV44_9BACT|nr:hypothetical protein [Gracilimonas mengyeensis]SMO75442.1 hypothetical protein SAMN06265219_109127 [Gracilimonas mengyeensis]